MKKPSILAIVAVLSLAGPAAVQAQQRGVPQGVAIVDLGYIFKNHQAFQDSKKQLQKDFDLAQVDFSTRTQQLQQMGQQLGDLKPGSPERKQLEVKLAQQQADIQVQFSLIKKQFIEREAQMFYDAYKQVHQEMAGYCKPRGIGLVIRFNGEPLTMDQPETMAMQLQRRIVYHDEALDITPYILQALNRGQRAVQQPGAQGQQVPFRR